MLDSHPRMAVPPESHFIPRLTERRRRYERQGGFRVDAFLADLGAEEGFEQWGLPLDGLRSALADHLPKDLPDALRATYRLHAQRSGKERFADKTPPYVCNLPLLADLFPESRFIHVIRDGRDVALSFLDMSFGPRRITKAALLWKERVVAGRLAGHQLGPDRYLEVRYESLASAPEAVVRAVCDFVDLEFDARTLNYHRRAREVVSGDGGRERHPGIFSPPIPGMRDWRTQMAPGDVGAFEAIAGVLLDELGYERNSPPTEPPTHETLRALVEEAERSRQALARTRWKLRVMRWKHRESQEARDRALAKGK